MMEEAIEGQPVIQAKRLVLRPVQRSDVGLFDLYAGDERVSKMTKSIPNPLPPGASEAFVARCQAKERAEDVWVMDGTTSGLGEVMGVVSLKRMDCDKAKKAEIAYWVAPAFWNAGLASEAVETLLEHNPTRCDTVFAEVFQDNAISARVVTNAGFEYIGDAEAFSVARAAMVPTWTYLKRLR